MGKNHTCAVVARGSVRCWGYGREGELGYPDTISFGATQTPASVGPVDLGPGRSAVAISAGAFHTCAILDDGSVRCWGYGGNGRLGYGNTSNVGDTQTPGSAGPVDLGPGRTASAISAGGSHTCAILDDGSVRCWGFNFDGQLGYGNTINVGGTQTPAAVAPVDLGSGRTARAISAGDLHTCAILDDGSVRCWGYGATGQLGYGNTRNVGDTQTPGSAGPVDLGPGRSAVAISAGGYHTCAILDDGSVRCWGFGGSGQLGYGNTSNVGDKQTPGSVGPVDLGAGRSATAISAGANHTCVILDDGRVRCWGYGGNGRLGYGNTSNVGDTQTPGSVGPVDLGAGRTATAISAGGDHTCARLNDGSVRCWGYGGNGRLGYCNESDIGETPTTTPGKVGAVNLEPGDGGVGCSTPRGGGDDSRAGRLVKALRLQALRARGLRACLERSARRPRRARRRDRQTCLARFGRTPGRVKTVQARAISSTMILLTFTAPGSDSVSLSAARAYLVRQSRHPIRGLRDREQAQSLCHGSCRFNVSAVGTKIELTIKHLARHTTYYFTIAARDNVSARLGAYSPAVEVTTR